MRKAPKHCGDPALSPPPSAVPSRRVRRRPCAGITLLELLVGLGLSALLLTLTVSALGGLSARNIRVTVVNNLAGYLNYARSEAVLRGLDVVVCPVSAARPDAGCTDGRDQWARGYAVLVRDTGELLRFEQAPSAIAMVANVRAFVFQPDGSLETAAGGSISICAAGDDSDGASSPLLDPRRVIVSGAGRVRFSDEDLAGCG